MKINTVNGFICSRSLRFLHFVACMKEYTINIILYIVILNILFTGLSHAGTWRDEFREAELNGWERIVEKNPWIVKWILVDEPFNLYAQILKPKDEQVTAADFLHWNIHQFQLNRLTVIGEGMFYNRYSNDNSGEFCFFLGKRQPEPDFAAGYIFSPEKTTKMEFSANGVYKIGEVEAKYDGMFRLTSGHLKVVFDAGKFRLFTQNILITEFFDAEVSMIDVVGLIVMFDFPGNWFRGSISTFSITGKGIPNHNSLDVQMQETQLTTTWGALKRF